MRKIIFVCLGNTCRSPMAEVLFRAYLQKQNIKDVEVASYGLSAPIGEPATQNAIEACERFGFDLRQHRARQLTPIAFRPHNNFFVCMTEDLGEILSHYIPNSKILSLHVPDPYGKTSKAYTRCVNQILKDFPRIVEHFLLQLSIHKMNEMDVAEIEKIEKECFIHPWSQQSISEELTNEQARFFVAKVGEEYVGYIGANNVLGEVYMANLAVKSAYRKRGVASELLSKLIADSAKENAEFVTLEVRKSNTGAIALYENFGFQQVGERKDFYTEPDENALLFTKILK